MTEVFQPGVVDTTGPFQSPGGYHSRFFLDFDCKEVVADPDTTSRSITVALENLLRECGLGRQRYHVFFKRNMQGVHVVFRDLLFSTKQGEDERAARYWVEHIESTRLALVASQKFPEAVVLGPFKLDKPCTMMRNLRMPFSYPPGYDVQIPKAQLPFYFLAKNYPNPNTSSNDLVLGSIWLISQARNPVSLGDLPRAHVLPPQNVAPPMDVEPNNPVAVARNPNTQPAWLVKQLEQNDPRRFLVMTRDHAYGNDFPPDSKPAPTSVDLMVEIHAAASQLGFGSSDEDVNLEIIKVFNKHFAWLSKQAVILARNYAVVGNNDLEFDTWQSKSFISTFKNVKWIGCVIVKDKNGNYVPRKKSFDCVKIWMESPGRRTYTDVIFCPYPQGHPSGPKKDQLNIYTGWAWKPEELREAYHARLTPARMAVINAFQRHIYEVLCNRDLEKFQWLLCLLCKKFRQPWFRPDCCPVLTGNEGSGKTTPFDFILQYAGKCGAKCTDVEQLLGNFNAEYRNKLILYLDEASWVGAIRSNNQLKTFITSDTHRTEQKYRDSQVSPNYTLMFMTANDPVVVKQGEHARRWALFNVKLNTARGNPMAHKQYFDVIYKMQDDDWTCMKIWLYQFYEPSLYPQGMLDAFGNFGNHTFPTACVCELENQKTFSMTTISKYWQQVLIRGYTYRPSLDFSLNASDAREFLFTNNSKNPRDALISEAGRQLSDIQPEPGKNYQNIKSFMDAVRHPAWKPENAWLGTFNLKLVYDDYRLSIANNQIQARKGIEDTVDLSSFQFQTDRIFTSILNQEGSRKFEYQIPAAWKQRSSARTTAKSDMEWVANHRHDTTNRGEFYDERMIHYTLGTLEECREAFYLFSGIDLTEKKVHKTRDQQGRPKVYNDNWAEEILHLFDRI